MTSTAHLKARQRAKMREIVKHLGTSACHPSGEFGGIELLANSVGSVIQVTPAVAFFFGQI